LIHQTTVNQENMNVALSLTETARLIRSKEISPVEVVQEHLNRISELNPELNAIVTLAPDLLDQAKEAESKLSRGETVGALHGVPVTIKDTIETQGVRTTSGSMVRSEYVPTSDAPSVARLKAAGAIILGKTNAAEMAMDYTADNPLFGRTNHPQSPLLTPGGSSGGEAVAIATNMSAGGLGSDLAGSIRIPAHFCGIAGLKPTTGRVSGDGQYPPSTGPYSLGAVIGPMARSVGDLRTLFRVLIDSDDSKSFSTSGLRVAWFTTDGKIPVSDDTARTVKNVARALVDAGLVCEERLPPHVERGNELWLKLFSRASVVQLRQAYAGRESAGGSFVSWRLANADTPPPSTLDEYIRGWMERDYLRAQLLAWMETTPIIVAPVGPTPAYQHDTLKLQLDGSDVGVFRAFGYAQAFNVFDLPVVVVPAGRSSDGLPIGVQIVGRPNCEELVLAVAELVEGANCN
jgi:Asp-tRNA(Asn)/Glu-tRNA(Gln) amidotransferase A subunit family amidase